MSSPSPTPSLKIHHLRISQSERLPWLLEELSLPYTLIIHHRSPYFSPPSIHALNPLGQAPILQDGSLTLFESAACVEYIVQKHGNGRLMLPPTHKDYAQFLFWWHFSNGNLQPLVMGKLQVERLTANPAGKTEGKKEGKSESKADGTGSGSEAGSGTAHGGYAATVQARFEKTLRFMDERLRNNEWLAGSEFTAADIMCVWSLTTMRVFCGFELFGYEGILGWLKRCTDRKGYRVARGKADPGLESFVGAGRPRGYGEMLKDKEKEREGKGE